MPNSVLYNIYNDLVNAMKTVIPAKFIRLGERPNIIDSESKVQRMAVIELPVRIGDYVAGNRKTLLQTDGVFYLFTQSKKDGTLDIKPTGEFVDSVVNLFPIVGEYCTAVNPQVRMLGDKEGFQVTMVTFELRSRWGAFSN